MLFMVIETFRNGDALSAYRRFRDDGRGAPEGVEYVGSWIEASLNRCFQLMETDDVGLLHIGPDAVAAATLAPAAFEPGLAPFNCWPPQQPWAAVVLVVANTSSTRPVTTDLVAGDRRSGPNV